MQPTRLCDYSTVQRRKKKMEIENGEAHLLSFPFSSAKWSKM